MLLEKLLKEFNFSTNIFNWEEFKLFDQYFERILVSKGTFLIKEGETERYSYFVFDGILRCWLLNHNGEEQTFWFCKEGTFSMSNISILNDMDSLSAMNVRIFFPDLAGPRLVVGSILREISRNFEKIVSWIK